MHNQLCILSSPPIRRPARRRARKSIPVLRRFNQAPALDAELVLCADRRQAKDINLRLVVDSQDLVLAGQRCDACLLVVLKKAVQSRAYSSTL